jgi:hypothetical protein
MGTNERGSDNIKEHLIVRTETHRISSPHGTVIMRYTDTSMASGRNLEQALYKSHVDYISTSLT